MYVIRWDLKNAIHIVMKYPIKDGYYSISLDDQIKPEYKEIAIKLGAVKVLIDAHTLEYQFKTKKAAEKMSEFIDSIVIMRKLKG